MPYLSASAVVIHYEEALYQMYAPFTPIYPFNYIGGQHGQWSIASFFSFISRVFHVFVFCWGNNLSPLSMKTEATNKTGNSADADKPRDAFIGQSSQQTCLHSIC